MSFFLSGVAGGPHRDLFGSSEIDAGEAQVEQAFALIQRIEADHDRVRLERWGPRTLDLDIIDFDGAVMDDPELIIPHPRAHERGFVLQPWSRVDPEAVLRVGGEVRRVAELLAEVATDDIEEL